MGYIEIDMRSLYRFQHEFLIQGPSVKGSGLHADASPGLKLGNRGAGFRV